MPSCCTSGHGPFPRPRRARRSNAPLLDQALPLRRGGGWEHADAHADRLGVVHEKFINSGSIEQAERYTGRALRLAEQLDDVGEECRALGVAAVVAAEGGDLLASPRPCRAPGFRRRRERQSRPAGEGAGAYLGVVDPPPRRRNQRPRPLPGRDPAVRDKPEPSIAGWGGASPMRSRPPWNLAPDPSIRLGRDDEAGAGTSARVSRQPSPSGSHSVQCLLPGGGGGPSGFAGEGRRGGGDWALSRPRPSATHQLERSTGTRSTRNRVVPARHCPPEGEIETGLCSVRFASLLAADAVIRGPALPSNGEGADKGWSKDVGLLGVGRYRPFDLAEWHLPRPLCRCGCF